MVFVCNQLVTFRLYTSFRLYTLIMFLYKNKSVKYNSKVYTVSRNPQYKDVYRRTIEMPQRARPFKVNFCLNVHNAHLILLSKISG